MTEFKLDHKITEEDVKKLNALLEVWSNAD